MGGCAGAASVGLWFNLFLLLLLLLSANVSWRCLLTLEAMGWTSSFVNP